jgi:hypothetical protein
MHYRYCFLATLLLVGGAGAASAQNSNTFNSLFGRTAPAEEAWRKVPRNEMGCIERGLAQQRSNVQALIQSGVMPGDPRIGQLRTYCHGQAAAQTAQPQPAGQASPYVVDRVALGGRLQPDSPAYREYQCAPSEQFPGFTWCQKQRQEKKPGAIAFSNSILHSQDGTAVYVNRSIQPATFERGEIDKEIERLSARYGERARVMRMPSAAGADGTAVIAQWGQIELEPVSPDALTSLASGKDVTQGLMVDYLGDFTRSAKLGLPVYRIAGGAGYLWTASSDQKGRGHLRLLASNASAYVQAAPQPPANPEVVQVAKPDSLEQAATVGAAKINPGADDAAQRTVAEAAGAKTESARVKAEADEVAPAPSKPGSEKAITERVGAEADGPRDQSEPAQAETNYFWVVVASVVGLVVVLSAGAALMLLRRRRAKETAQAQLQERFAAQFHAMDIEAPLGPAIGGPERIAEPDDAMDIDAPTAPIVSEHVAERGAEPHHAADIEAPVVEASIAPIMGKPATQTITPSDPNLIVQVISRESADLDKRHCPACGHDLQLAARFCSNCGYPIDLQD